MRYEIVAEAYRDLEAATARLALIDRLAALIAETPTTAADGDAAVPGRDRARLRRGGARPGRADGRPRGRRGRRGDRRAGARRRPEAGDLGLAAERLLAALAPRPATLEVEVVFGTPAPDRPGRGDRLAGPQAGALVGLLREATPLEARYLVRTVTG